MKLHVFVAALAAALVAVGAASSGNHRLLTGSFKTSISGKTTRLNGTWVLRIDRLGQSTTTLKGNQLALKVGFDQCSGRETILAAHPLTRIASPATP